MNRLPRIVVGTLLVCLACVSTLQAGWIRTWGRPADPSHPEAIPPGDDFVAVATGWYYSIALREDGSLAYWGPGHGEIPSTSDFVAVAAYSLHGLIL